MRGIFLILAVLLSGLATAANECTSKSPAHRVALVELYSSEGCNSCPPTDQYFGGLRAQGLKRDQAVLLALHVDYWDYIGWKDPFARADFTERQRWLTRLSGRRTVYTPEVFVSGREQYPVSKLIDEVARTNQLPAAAEISLHAGPVQNGQVQIQATASARSEARLFVALTEDGLSSQVRAGENRGRTLHHDAVARYWADPLALQQDAPGHQTVSLNRQIALPAGANPAHLQLTAFVQNPQGDILQAWSLPLCAP